MAMRGIRVIVCLHLILCSSPFSYCEVDADDETLYNSENIIKGQDEEENRGDDLVCSIPIIPINGYIVGTDDRIGAVVSFHCNPGYRLVGSPTMTCIAIPSPWKHSVMWDPEDDRQCQRQAHPNNEISYSITEGDRTPKSYISKSSKAMEEYKTYNIISNEINAKNEKENTFQNRHSKQFQNKKEKMVNGEIKDSPNMPQYAPEMSEQPKGQESLHLSEGISDFCLLPPDPGSCSDHIVRFYFDPSTGECDKFMYTGCDGNSNNFLTLADCDSMC